MTVHIDGIIFSLQRHGGISVYTRELVRHLARERLAAVLTLEMPVAQTLDALDCPGMPLRAEWRQARPAERYRACRAPESATVFHSSYYRVPSSTAIPAVTTVHDFVYERFSRGPRRWVHLAQKHRAIRRAQALICISESTRQDLEYWVGVRPRQQVFVIPNGVSDAFRPLDRAIPAVRPYVLYVGERRGYKNFAVLARAMSLLPQLDLLCVGGGELREQELSHVSPSLRERVRHVGFVTDEVLNDHYNRAVCLAYPSSYEGFGIPVVEAMRAGCPVVCIQCKAVLEVGRNALVVAPAAEPRALANAIESVSQPARRAEIVRAGLEVARGYSWRATHERTLDVYRSLGTSLRAND